MVTIGSSGSSTVRPVDPRPKRGPVPDRRRTVSRSPGRSRMRAVEVLHLREQVAEVLGVQPLDGHRLAGATSGTAQRRLVDHSP